MIDELQKILPSFRGRRGHVRCMAHIINLVAKGILRPFEVKKKQTSGSDNNGNGDDDSPDLASALEELQAQLRDLEENGVCDEDDDDGFVNMLKEMSEGEMSEWTEAVAPIHMALVKVCLTDPNWYSIELTQLL